MQLSQLIQQRLAKIHEKYGKTYTIIGYTSTGKPKFSKQQKDEDGDES